MEKQVVFLIAMLGVIFASVAPLAGQNIVVDFDDLGFSDGFSYIPENYIDKDTETNVITPGIFWYKWDSDHPVYGPYLFLGDAHFMTQGANQYYQVEPQSGDNYAFNFGQTGDSIGFSFDETVGFDNVLLKGGWFAGVYTDYFVEQVRFVGYDSPDKTNVLACSTWQEITGQMSFVHAQDETGKYFGLMGYIEIEYYPVVTYGGSDGTTEFPHRYAVDDLTFHRQPVAQAGSGNIVHPGDPVALDGSLSYDPDENYPLTYLWQVVSAPLGSAAGFADSTAATTTFTPDLMGDYVLQLIVTDSNGGPSQPDSVAVGTFNTPPVAEAGDDIALYDLGTVVQLKGSESYDDEGDEISYVWTIITRPEGSLAELNDPTLENPTFVADLNGDYIIQLVVTDEFDAVSEPDTVLASFFNVKPVADAGGNQSVAVGETVTLDGSGSYDQNLDDLSYHWSFVSVPQGSLAALDDPEAISPSFVADVLGAYVVSLVVNDGWIDSLPDNVSIEAITSQEAASLVLTDVVAIINTLDPEVFRNRVQARILTMKVNLALRLIDRGNYGIALLILQYNTLRNMDGCAETGEPDRNDWIRDCDAQAQVYPLVIEAIGYLADAI